MIHIQKRVAISSPGGCTAAEYEQFCRLHFAGALHLSPPCLSTFRAQNHRSNESYLPWLHWYHEEVALTTKTEYRDSDFVLSGTTYEVIPGTYKDGHWNRRALSHKALVELPPEIVAHIHSYIDVIYDSRRCDRWLLLDSELAVYRALEACALVCTHWANYFRPMLLKHRLGGIKSDDHMRLVKSMVCWVGTKRVFPLRAYATQNGLSAALTITLQEHETPSCLWFHHLGLLNINLKDCSLHIETAPNLTKTFVALYDLQAFTFLPKTVLPSNFRPFTELTLRDAWVPSLEALLRFLRQFSRIRKLILSRIGFGKASRHIIPGPAGSTHNVPPRPVNVSVTDTTHGPRHEAGNYALFKAIINSFFPELPICALPSSDCVLAQRLLTEYHRADSIESYGSLETVWDGIADTVHFDIGPSGRRSRSIISFICPKESASDHTLSDQRLLTAVCLHITIWRYVSYVSHISKLDFPSMFRLIQEATTLKVILLSFNDCAAMKQFFKQNPPLSHFSNITYNLACRHRKNLPLRVTEEGKLDLDALPRYSEVDNREMGRAQEVIPETCFDSHWYVATVHKTRRTQPSEYGDYIWDLIDPETLQLTGDQFFEHDNIAPELLRRRGIHTVVSPDCPSEDAIRAMLEAKAQDEAINDSGDGIDHGQMQ